MKLRECIVLAGGLGTRLRSAVPDLPKCMAPVAGAPFLQHMIRFLQEEGIEHFIFSLGYRHDAIEAFLKKEYPNLSYQAVIEEEPMGTGGAIRMACEKAGDENVLVVNGDTMFRVSVDALARFHHQHRADCTLTLKPMKDFDRYGVVDIDADGHIQSFREKKYYASGLINGGVYALNIPAFTGTGLTGKFSFEKDYLEHFVGSRTMLGLVQDQYFIDIGIPADFERANRELAGIK